jgi:hypothetical protein
VIWTRGDEATRAKWLARMPNWIQDEEESHPRTRTLVGALVIALGVWAFLSSNPPLDLFDNAPLAVATVLFGIAVIAGPGIWRLVRQASDERRERIRQEERAEMAAHLHDSVLQTLALIQRTEDPNEMVALARGQERELRTWLYGKTKPGGEGSLSAALDAVAVEVERAHRTRIEIVMVGDCPLDDGVRALVHACREAFVNAARHSGARGVSAYVEVEDDQVTAYVRDQGRRVLARGRCPATATASPSRSRAAWSATAASRSSTARSATAPRSACGSRGAARRDPGLPGRGPRAVRERRSERARAGVRAGRARELGGRGGRRDPKAKPDSFC